MIWGPQCIVVATDVVAGIVREFSGKDGEPG